MTDSDQNGQNQNQNPNHEHHQNIEPNSSMNMLWGLLLAALTFILVVICALTIHILSDSVPEDKPSPTPTEEITPTPTENPTGTPTVTDTPAPTDDPTDTPTPTEAPTPTPVTGYVMTKTEKTKTMLHRDSGDLSGVGVLSENAVVVCMDTNEIAAEMNCDDKIYPASMTKVMTLLVAAEHLGTEDLKKYVTLSEEIINYCQSQNASGFGFQANDELTVEALLYAIALESDCAASIQIAAYVAGSEEAFVEMMNAKAKELGLVSTHFSNASGLHDENNYTTCREMASIMAAACDNELVYTLLSSDGYATQTKILGNCTFFSTYFNDILGSAQYALKKTSPDNGRILAVKTGYTDEAGYCLVTYLKSDTGRRYVAVTCKSKLKLLCVEDHVYIYEKYAE